MDIYERLGKILEQLRGRSRQADFAELIGLQQSHYARIEKGQNRLQLHQLVELGQRLNMTIIISDGEIEFLNRTKTTP